MFRRRLHTRQSLKLPRVARSSQKVSSVAKIRTDLLTCTKSVAQEVCSKNHVVKLADNSSDNSWCFFEVQGTYRTNKKDSLFEV